MCVCGWCGIQLATERADGGEVDQLVRKFALSAVESFQLVIYYCASFARLQINQMRRGRVCMCEQVQLDQIKRQPESIFIQLHTPSTLPYTHVRRHCNAKTVAAEMHFMLSACFM